MLSRDPREITALEVIRAIEGPLFITSCSNSGEAAARVRSCTVREPLRKVSRTIEEVLGKLTVWELTRRRERSSAVSWSRCVEMRGRPSDGNWLKRSKYLETNIMAEKRMTVRQ